MHILALADEADSMLWEHLDKKLLENVELILSAGDLPAEYLSYLTCFTHAPIFYIHGNHDERYRTAPPEGCECIEDRIACINGIRVLGLGGSMRYRKGDCMYTEAEMRGRIRRVRGKIRRAGGFDILLTHAPMRGYGDLEDLCHQGFTCFQQLITQYNPQVMIYGHVHQSYGRKFNRELQFGNTRLINASKRYFIDVDPAVTASPIVR